MKNWLLPVSAQSIAMPTAPVKARPVVQLVADREAGAPLPVTPRIAGLHDEVRHDAVEGHAGVEAPARQRHEVRRGQRRVQDGQLDLDGAAARVDEHVGRDGRGDQLRRAVPCRVASRWAPGGWRRPSRIAGSSSASSARGLHADGPVPVAERRLEHRNGRRPVRTPRATREPPRAPRTSGRRPPRGTRRRAPARLLRASASPAPPPRRLVRPGRRVSVGRAGCARRRAHRRARAPPAPPGSPARSESAAACSRRGADTSASSEAMIEDDGGPHAPVPGRDPARTAPRGTPADRACEDSEAPHCARQEPDGASGPAASSVAAVAPTAPRAVTTSARRWASRSRVSSSFMQHR